MIGFCRARAVFFVARGVQHGQHLQDSNAARTRRRRGNDVVALVVPLQWLPLDRLIVAQVRERDHTALLRPRMGEELSGLALREITGSESSDAIQGQRQFWLPKR